MKYWQIIPLSLFAIVPCYFINKERHHRQQLRDTGKWTSGYILHAYNEQHNSSGELHVEYTYHVNGVKYRHHTYTINVRADAYKTYITKWFPVIYNPNDPQHSDMLLSPDDFESYQQPVPDSLRWISDFVYKSF